MQLQPSLLSVPLLLMLLCAKLQPTDSLTVPKTGVYILTVIADPATSTSLEVKIKVNGAHVCTAYARRNVMGGFDTALPLDAGDSVTYERTSGQFSSTNRSTIGATYVSDDLSGFETVRDVYTTYQRSQLVMFRDYLDTDSDSWFSRAYGYIFKHYTVPNTGIYWVMLRVACKPGRWARVGIKDALFTVHCKSGIVTSTSGAFHLTAATEFTLKYMEGNSRLLKNGTTFSYVHLKNNNASTVGGGHAYMAYTAFGHKGSRLAFNHDVKTNYGNMYDKARNSLTISVNGTYAIAIRGAPTAGKTLRLDVALANGGNLFSFYSERGHQSGQTAFFHLMAGDVLSVTADNDGYTAKDIMLSIAFIYPAYL